jgi:hypothetical protein
MKDRGDLTGAAKTYNQSQTLCHEINFQNCIFLSCTGCGTVFDKQGNSTEAVTLLKEAASGQSGGSPDLLVDLGDARQNLGDLAGSRKNCERALDYRNRVIDWFTAPRALCGEENPLRQVTLPTGGPGS